jgi:hypothetical protein
MKKLVKLLVFTFCISAIVVSCKDSKKETETEVEQTELGVEKADLAMIDVYQCPMDCENGKTYDKEGICPVCEMNLKKVEKEEEGTHQHEDGEKHEDHN